MTRPLMACVISAMLMAAAHNVSGCELLVWVALVPFLARLNPRKYLSTLAQFGLTVGLFELSTLYWLAEIGDGYGSVLALAVAYHVAHFAMPVTVCWLVGRFVSPDWDVLTLPGSWALVELLGRSFLLRVWSPMLGQPCAEWPLVAQIVALAGPEMSTFLVVSVNVSLAIWARTRGRIVRAVAAVQALACLTLALAWGRFSLERSSQQAPSWRVGVLQPNIDSDSKWDPARRARNLRLMDRLIDGLVLQEPACTRW